MDFQREIFRNWGTAFDLDPDVFLEPGTEWRPRAQDDESFGIHIWCIGKRSVVRAHPSLEDVVREMIRVHPNESLTEEHVLAGIPSERVKSHTKARVWYLHPEHKLAPPVPAGVEVRAFTPDDRSAMTTLHEACPAKETEEAYVEVEHAVGFGAFEGSALLAAATGYEFSGFLDLGVLTHPKARRRGLGAAVVAATALAARERGMIPQYRHADWNEASSGVPRLLGFEQWLRQDSVWMHRATDPGTDPRSRSADR